MIFNIFIYFFYLFIFFFFSSDVFAENNHQEINKSCYDYYNINNKKTLYDQTDKAAEFFFRKQLSRHHRIIIREVISNDPDFVRIFGKDLRNVTISSKKEEDILYNLLKKIIFNFTQNKIWNEMPRSILFSLINDGCGPTTSHTSSTSCEYAKFILKPYQFRCLIEDNNIEVWKIVTDSMKGKTMSFDLLDEIKKNNLKTNHLYENYFLNMTPKRHKQWLLDMHDFYIFKSVSKP